MSAALSHIIRLYYTIQLKIFTGQKFHPTQLTLALKKYLAELIFTHAIQIINIHDPHFIIKNKLPIKTLVTRRWPTNIYTYTHTYIHTCTCSRNPKTCTSHSEDQEKRSYGGEEEEKWKREGRRDAWLYQSGRHAD